MEDFLKPVWVCPPNTEGVPLPLLFSVNSTDLPQESAYLKIFGNVLGLYATSKDSPTGLPTPIPDSSGRLYWDLAFRFDNKWQSVEVARHQVNCLALPYVCTSMCVTPPCCTEDGEMLRRLEGITVGDLVQVAMRIRAEHEHCPRRAQMVWSSISSPLYPRFAGITYHQIGAKETKRIEMMQSDPKLLKEEIKWVWDQQEQDQMVADLNLIWEEGKNEAGERWRAMLEDGWGPISTAFFESVDAAKNMNLARLPSWPSFLAMHRHLLPQGTVLNEYEETATLVSREAVRTEYGDDNIGSD